jgi:hypothetical protein
MTDKKAEGKSVDDDDDDDDDANPVPASALSAAVAAGSLRLEVDERDAGATAAAAATSIHCTLLTVDERDAGCHISHLLSHPLPHTHPNTHLSHLPHHTSPHLTRDAGFAIGDTATLTDKVDPQVNEMIKIRAFGSIILAAPLQHAYSAGSSITRLARGSRGVAEPKKELVSALCDSDAEFEVLQQLVSRGGASPAQRIAHAQMIRRRSSVHHKSDSGIGSGGGLAREEKVVEDSDDSDSSDDEDSDGKKEKEWGEEGEGSEGVEGEAKGHRRNNDNADDNYDEDDDDDDADDGTDGHYRRSSTVSSTASSMTSSADLTSTDSMVDMMNSNWYVAVIYEFATGAASASAAECC